VTSTAALGCGSIGVPLSDLTTCPIGILRRQLELFKQYCTTALWEKLGREGCQELIDRRRQPGLDPSKPIVVAFVREVFTATGQLGYSYHNDDTTCGALGVAGSKP
jgi:hypothetical protein